MKINREIQLKLLQTLADAYPDGIGDEWESLISTYGEINVRANVYYLNEHGLVRYTNPRSGFTLHITADGIDFLREDGGLSAILGTVTIKLHDDTLRSLIALRISESDLDQPDKTKLLGQLRELPGETIKHLTLKLVDAGLGNWPTALLAIQTFFRGHGV